jgi:hypothetical protein
VEKVVEVESDTIVTLISEEQGIKDKYVSFSLFCLTDFVINYFFNNVIIELSNSVDPEKESDVYQTILADSPMMGIIELSNSVDPEKESDVYQTILADSPMMGLASNSDLQDAPPCDITFDVQDDPEKESELDQTTTYSPIMGLVSDTQDDVGIEKMLNSVVRHFARASIKDSAKKIDATDKMISDDVPELEQNENAVKEKVDLGNMSLRKLKALYKDHLTELNSKKVTP